MLGAAGNKNPAIANYAGNDPRNGTADTALRVDVGIIEHENATIKVSAVQGGLSKAGRSFHRQNRAETSKQLLILLSARINNGRVTTGRAAAGAGITTRRKAS
jgi:hypothetical protein